MQDIAAALGVNPSAKLKFAAVPGAYRTGSIDNKGTLLTTGGYVDFSPVRTVVAGDAPNYFPPKSYTPGSRGTLLLLTLRGRDLPRPFVLMMLEIWALASRPIAALLPAALGGQDGRCRKPLHFTRNRPSVGAQVQVSAHSPEAAKQPN